MSNPWLPSSSHPHAPHSSSDKLAAMGVNESRRTSYLDLDALPNEEDVPFWQVWETPDSRVTNATATMVASTSHAAPSSSNPRNTTKHTPTNTAWTTPLPLPRQDYRMSIPRKTTKKAMENAQMEDVPRYISKKDMRRVPIPHDNFANRGYARSKTEQKNASGNAPDYPPRKSRNEKGAASHNPDRSQFKKHTSQPGFIKPQCDYKTPEWLRDNSTVKLDHVSPDIRGSKPLPAWLKDKELNRDHSRDHNPIERKTADYGHRDRDFDVHDAKRKPPLENSADYRSGVDYRARAAVRSSSSFEHNRPHAQRRTRYRSRSRSRSRSPVPIRRSRSSSDRDYRDYDSPRPSSPVRSKYLGPPSRSLDGFSGYKHRTEEIGYESRKYETSRRYPPDKSYSPVRRRERSYEKRRSYEGSSSDEDYPKKAKDLQLRYSRDSPRNRIGSSRDRGEEYDGKRLFLAINLPDHLRFCLASLLVEQIPDCNPIADEDYHMTLNFIPNSSVDKVDRAIRNIRFPSFDIQLQTLSAFPSWDHPRVVVVLADFSQKLIDLQKQISYALKRSSIKFDTKEFNPHVTIARISDMDAVEKNKTAVNMFLAENKVFYSPTFEVEEFALTESLPESANGKYRAVRHYELTRGRDEATR